MAHLQSLNSWVICTKRRPNAQLRLFCFPYAGGGASIYRTWWTSLPEEVEICAIQLPGRENRLMEPAFTRCSVLVQALMNALYLHLDIPFAFFGHSMGALVGFEFARALYKKDRTSPVHLFVSGYRAPHLPENDPSLHLLPDEELIEKLRTFEGIPEPVLRNTELMRLLLPSLRADFAICETYAYSKGDPLPCPISVFGGLQDRKVGEKELKAWCSHTQHSFVLRMLEGKHFFLHTASEYLLQSIACDIRLLLIHNTNK